MTLQEILTARNIPEDQIKGIVEDMKTNKIFTASEENLDIRYAKLKTDHENLTAQHNESTKLIEQFKAGAKDNEALQGKITSYESQIAQLQEQLKTAQLDSEIKIALLGAKAVDVDYMTFKLKEKGDLELDDQGHIKGIEDKLAGLKTQFPNQFESEFSQQTILVNKLPKSDDRKAVYTKEEFAKMGYNERLKLKQENESLFRQLTTQN